jgi:hypothetical protein
VRAKLFGVLVASALLSACATNRTDSDVVKAALAEQDIAQARLLKAIGSYCSARHDLVEARHRCVVEKNAEALVGDIAVFTPGSATGPGAWDLSGTHKSTSLEAWYPSHSRRLPTW